jgi:hypothetical protein
MSRAGFAFAEIRNRIYAAAVAGENDAVTLDNGRREDIKRITRYAPSNWPSDHRTSLGLTRTCRQLRSELLAIYFRHLNAKVPYMQIYEYCDTFVLQRNPGQMSSMDHNITLTAEAIDVRESLFIEQPEIDILPLLRLCRTIPGLRIHFLGSDKIQSVLASMIKTRNTDSQHHSSNQLQAQLPSQHHNITSLSPQPLEEGCVERHEVAASASFHRRHAPDAPIKVTHRTCTALVWRCLFIVS